MTTDGWRLLALTLALHAGLAGVSAAEQAGTGSSTPGPVYLQITPVVTVHTAGEQYHRASPPLKGTTVGGALALGVDVVPELAFEAEVMVDGKLSAPIVDSYSTRTDYTAESRDIVLGANLRFRPRGGSHLEFTAGGGLAFSRFARRDIVVTSFFPPGITTRQPDQETSTTNPTVSGSMAIAIPLSPHVELVPSIGARWIRREFDTDAWYFGVGRYTVFFSAALRLRP